MPGLWQVVSLFCLLLCVETFCKCWCMNLSYCPMGPGRKQPGRETDLENLKMNPKKRERSEVLCKCSPVYGLNLHKARSLQDGAFPL